jgi:uncharacterized membrane protein YkvA (DUF1232 family)
MADKWKILRTADSGFIQNLILQGRLILRLMGDGRVSFLLKLLPIGALIYLVSPVDLLPGVVFPGIGALDDAAVIWLGATLFVNMCPEGIVKEHMLALQKGITSAWQGTAGQDDNDEVIDVEAREVPKNGK